MIRTHKLNPTFCDFREVKHCEDGSNNSVNKLLTATAALLNQHKEKQDKEKERFHEEKDFEERKIAWPADKDAYELGEVIGKHSLPSYREQLCRNRYIRVRSPLIGICCEFSQPSEHSIFTTRIIKHEKPYRQYVYNVDVNVMCSPSEYVQVRFRQPLCSRPRLYWLALDNGTDFQFKGKTLILPRR